jgi:hypothetical protein
MPQLQDLSPDELDILRQIIAARSAAPEPGPADLAAGAPAPASSPAAPYNDRAAQYNAQADQFDKEAAVPMPTPVGAKQHAVEAIRAGLENFGRLGAPGGYYGQEEKRQKSYDEDVAAKVKRAQELRTQAQQQQTLGQQSTYQAGELANQAGNLDVSRGNLAVNQQEAATRAQVAGQPKTENIGTGAVGITRDPKTGLPIKGSEVYGPDKPATGYNLESKVIDEGKGKFGLYAVDMRDNGRIVARIGDAPPPGAGGTGGLPTPTTITDPKTGMPIAAGYDRKANTITPAKLAGDTSGAPVQAATVGNANARAVTTSAVGVNAAQNLLASMQDTLDRIKSGKSQAIGADDMNLLSSHLAMTFGTVKGARTGRDLIEAHVHARDLGDEMQVIMERVLNGGQLSPGQREEFVHLAQQRLNELKTGKQNLQNDFGTPAPAATSSGNTPIKPGGALDRLLNGGGR